MVVSGWNRSNTRFDQAQRIATDPVSTTTCTYRSIFHANSFLQHFPLPIDLLHQIWWRLLSAPGSHICVSIVYSVPIGKDDRDESSPAARKVVVSAFAARPFSTLLHSSSKSDSCVSWQGAEEPRLLLRVESLCLGFWYTQIMARGRRSLATTPVLSSTGKKHMRT